MHDEAMRPEDQPKSELAIVVCSDRGLLWQSAHLLQQIRAGQQGAAADLYYYTNESVASDFLDIFTGVQVVICHEDLDMFENGTPRHVSQATLLRIFAIHELSVRYRHVAYMDSDTFVRWGRTSDIAGIDFGGAPIAAVRDRADWGRQKEHWFEKKYLPRYSKNVQSRYFNAGFLLIDGSRYQQDGVTEKTLAYLTKHPDLCHYGDQSALNYAIDGNWAELSPSWNWQVNTRYDFLIPARDPRIVHFTGPVKPWKDRMLRFDEYYLKTMIAWLRDNDMTAEIRDLESQRFSASKDRMRARLASENPIDPLAMRDFVKPYLDRTDFADIQAKIRAWGWNE